MHHRSFIAMASYIGLFALVCLPTTSIFAQGFPVSPSVLNDNATSDLSGDSGQDIVTDGAGNWIVTWFSSENVGGVSNSDLDIFVSTSSDNGDTWSSVATLNSNATSDSGLDARADIATDGAGFWVAVWYSEENFGGIAETDRDIYVALSMDNGSSWSPMKLLNSNGNDDLGDDSYPEIATDGRGNWVTVWHSDENLEGNSDGDHEIFVSTSTDLGSTWTTPALVNTNGNFDAGADLYPVLATDRRGVWVAAWHSNENLGGIAESDRDIFSATSFDNGATWSDPILVNTNGNFDSGRDNYCTIDTDGEGTWIVAWDSNENLGSIAETDLDILYAISTDNGATWSAPALINSNGNSDIAGDETVSIAADDNENWVATWRSNEDLSEIRGGIDTDIHFSTSADNGATWSATQILNTNGFFDIGNDFDPFVATDGARKWVTVWRSTENIDTFIDDDLDLFVSHFAFPQYVLSVPFYLDNASNLTNDGVPSDGTASFIGVKNTTASPLTMRITYTDTAGGDHTPATNTYMLPADSMVSWRPFADDPAEGAGSGQDVPNSVNGPAWGSVLIEADGPITGRLIVLDGIQDSMAMMLLPEGGGSSTLSVPFYLDNASNYVGGAVPSDGTASFIGIKNMSDEAITLTITYTDTEGTDRTPATNTHALPSNSVVSWRPAADDPIEGPGTGQAVPNTDGGPAWGSVKIKASGPVTGRLISIDGVKNTTALMLLPNE